MTKVLVGKYGQKVFFDREADEVKRSNTNGNQGNYRLLSLLFENNPDVEFWMASDNDGVRMFPNVYDAQNVEFKDMPKDFDAAVVIAGLPSYEKDRRYEQIVNASCKLAKRTVLLAEDPRCVDAMGYCARLKDFHPMVLSQTDGFIKFGGRWVKTKYCPLQVAIAYGHSTEPPKDMYELRVRDLLVVANSSDNDYGRISKVADLTVGANYFFDVFGRMVGDDVDIAANRGWHVREVDYEMIEQAFTLSKASLLVPVERDWLTSKYIEALLHGCMPVFYKDYATRLLNGSERAIIDLYGFKVANAVELSDAVANVKAISEAKYELMIRALYKALVTPYVDGRVLSNRIMEELTYGAE